MKPTCPHCESRMKSPDKCPKIVRSGTYYRKSDSKRIQRFHCEDCKKGFSMATLHPCYRQHKRHKNEAVRRALCSGVSQRRATRILCLNRKTVVRKLRFLAEQARLTMRSDHVFSPKHSVIEFDDLETFEHTKYKPLSVTLAVAAPSRKILGFQVSEMPAKGLLAKVSVKKYGPRKDLRSRGRKQLFEEIKNFVESNALIKSDSNPHYPVDIKKFFPQATHCAQIGRRGTVTGQSELKKVRFDPLFCLNHTCAKLRADINRLIRKTWCTTKKAERLADHLAMYARYHNQHLKA